MASLWSELLDTHLDELREQLGKHKDKRKAIARRIGVYPEYLYNIQMNRGRAQNLGVMHLKKVADALEELEREEAREKLKNSATEEKE